MIQKEYRYAVLLAKEMLSSEGGYFEESMCPLLGGRQPFHGSLEKKDVLHPVRKRTWTGTTFTAEHEVIYCLQVIMIDEDNFMYVYRMEELGISETERLLEAWSHGFIHDKVQEPKQEGQLV